MYVVMHFDTTNVITNAVGSIILRVGYLHLQVEFFVDPRLFVIAPLVILILRVRHKRVTEFVMASKSHSTQETW